MADSFNNPSGQEQERSRPAVSTYNAHQDEFGFQEGDAEGGVGTGTGTGTGTGVVGGEPGKTFDRAANEQTQFGLEEKASEYGHDGADPHLGPTETSPYGAGDPHASNFGNTPTSNTESIPAGDGWGREDTSRAHGAKKDGLVNKIKEKLPGQHHTAAGAEDPNAPPKKGVVEKIKEKLPGHQGDDAGV